jgi:hypothetical protein
VEVFTTGVLGIGNGFLNRTPVALEMRARIDKWDYLKLKSFCIVKETISESRGN